MTPGLETELLLLGNRPAGNSGLESGTGRESRHGRGGNLDFLARLRIAAHASSPLRGLEASEADQTNGIPLGHNLDNGTPYCLEGCAGAVLEMSAAVATASMSSDLFMYPLLAVLGLRSLPQCGVRAVSGRRATNSPIKSNEKYPET